MGQLARYVLPPYGGQTLGDLLLHAESGLHNASQLRQTANAIEEFERQRGAKSVTDISIEDVEAFVDFSRAKGASSSAVLRKVQALATFARRWTDSASPFQEALRRLRRHHRPGYRYGPLPNAELRQLLTSPGFGAARDATNGADALRFWLPLTVMLTGAHASAVVTARVSDLARHGDTWMLRLPERAREGNWLASTTGRWFPLHEELVRCGFLAYTARRKLDGHTHIFAHAGDRGALRALAAARLWFARLTNSHQLPQGQRSRSSLRRCFLAACAKTGMPMQWLYTVATGRWPRWAGPLHAPFTLNSPAIGERVAEFVARVRFDGVEFSHLYVERPFEGTEVLLCADGIGDRA